MSYNTLMVNLQLGRSNSGLLRVVGSLAARFEAGIIGIAACQPMQVAYADGYMSADLLEKDRAQIAKDMNAAELEFRTALESRARFVEWRSQMMFVSLADELAREARSADLVITGITSGGLLDVSQGADTGDLVMQVGRPVFVVPTAVDNLTLERVVLGWKDTREARRAASDALPLLKMATRVSVVEIAAEDELADAQTRVHDVVAWLDRHGIIAKPIASLSTGDDATRLAAIAQDEGADVIVAGAYGHSRLREWALGGVTRDLLMHAKHCSLLSH